MSLPYLPAAIIELSATPTMQLRTRVMCFLEEYCRGGTSDRSSNSQQFSRYVRKTRKKKQKMYG